jgi:hypothetical protein
MPHGELNLVHSAELVDIASVPPAVYEDPADIPDRDLARAVGVLEKLWLHALWGSRVGR